MNARGMNLLNMALVSLLVAPAAQAQWPQWGGPKRDFSTDSKGLASQWPADGPRKIWSRSLGEGYTSILLEGGTLYTMYRQGDDEILIAMDPATGKTVWEYKYSAPVPEGMETQFGKGPNATPTIHDGRIYALGVAGNLHAIDAKSGSLVWAHDLVKEFSAATPYFGFSSSPLVYKDTLIVAAGGTGTGLLAFKLQDGALVWKKHDFGGQERGDIYSSPILINVDGEDQVVLLAGLEVLGVDPKTGDKLWAHPHVNQWKTNICTPVWGSDGLLYVSSGGEAGSRGLKLSRSGGATRVEEVWATRKMSVAQGACARHGGMVFGSSGDTPAFIAAVNAADGKLAWRERGFSKANVVYGDGKLIILDEDGNLALATPTPEALTVHSKVQILKKPAWTTPTLVGKTLFVRDKETIIAFDLGQS